MLVSAKWRRDIFNFRFLDRMSVTWRFQLWLRGALASAIPRVNPCAIEDAMFPPWQNPAGLPRGAAAKHSKMSHLNTNEELNRSLFFAPGCGIAVAGLRELADTRKWLTKNSDC